MLLRKWNTWLAGLDMAISQDSRKHVQKHNGSVSFSDTHYGSTIIYSDVKTRIGLNNPETPNCESTLLEILHIHLRLLELGSFHRIEHHHNAPTDHIKQLLREFGIHPSHMRTEFAPIVFEDGEWSFDHGMYKYSLERRYLSGWFTKIKRELLQHLIEDRSFPDDGHIKIDEVESKTFYSKVVGPVSQSKVLSYFGIPECESTL